MLGVVADRRATVLGDEPIDCLKHEPVLDPNKLAACAYGHPLDPHSSPREGYGRAASRTFGRKNDASKVNSHDQAPSECCSRRLVGTRFCCEQSARSARSRRQH
jgi:hypothetical protein